MIQILEIKNGYYKVGLIVDEKDIKELYKYIKNKSGINSIIKNSEYKEKTLILDKNGIDFNIDYITRRKYDYTIKKTKNISIPSEQFKEFKKIISEIDNYLDGIITPEIEDEI